MKNKTTYKLLFLLFFFSLLGCEKAISQPAFVSVTPNLPPGYLIHYSDFWNITVMIEPLNPSAYYFLEIEIYDGKGNYLWKAVSYTYKIPSSPYFILSPDQPEIQPLSVSFTNEEWYRKMTVGGGVFPPGEYLIMYKLLETTLGCNTSGKRIATSTWNKSIRAVFPPMLLFPFNGDTILEGTLLMTWTPPFPVYTEDGFEYRVKVAEMATDQDPVVAITATRPAFYSRYTGFTQQLYPHEARPLVPGKRYAWQVEAYSSNQIIGLSQVWTFFVRNFSQPPPPLPVPKILFDLSSPDQGTYYTVDTDFVAFRYEEDYNDTDAALNYVLRNDTKHKVVMEGKADPYSVTKGMNSYVVYLFGMPSGYYTLLVRNEKNSERVLKFIYKKRENPKTIKAKKTKM